MMCQLNKHAHPETSDFMSASSDLLLQHPDLNPVNYKICIEIKQQVCLRELYDVNGVTLCMAGMALSNASSTTLQTSGVNVSDYRFYICTY